MNKDLRQLRKKATNNGSTYPAITEKSNERRQSVMEREVGYCRREVEGPPLYGRGVTQAELPESLKKGCHDVRTKEKESLGKQPSR